MSEFIKLIMIDFNTHADAIEREILIRSCDIISVHGDACVANNKCTEVITNMMDCKNTYFVKESVDEILRKIDPLPYTDLENYIFNTTNPSRSCINCKHMDKLSSEEPCRSCDLLNSKWIQKEEKND